MLIGQRLRQVREMKKLSQGDIEQRTGLIRCYTSRVENGHTVPSLETLEKFAHALEVPLYQLFYEGDAPREIPLPKPRNGEGQLSVKERRAAENVARMFSQLRRKKDRELVMLLIRKLIVRTS